MLLRSRADSIPIERGPSLFLCNPSAPPTSISSVSGHYKLLCLQDYLSIRGRMKCEKQSEKRRGHRYTTSGDTIMPMTDHFLTFIPQASVPLLSPALSLSLSFCTPFLLCFLSFCNSLRSKAKIAEVLLCLKDIMTFYVALSLDFIFCLLVFFFLTHVGSKGSKTCESQIDLSNTNKIIMNHLHTKDQSSHFQKPCSFSLQKLL